MEVGGIDLFASSSTNLDWTDVAALREVALMTFCSF